MADTLRFVKDIYPQLREKLIYRNYINQKHTQKKAQGWDEVHEAIKSAPYCHRHQQISHILYCHECMHHAKIYCCALCVSKIKTHYIKYPGFNNNEYEESFIRLHLFDRWCDQFRADYIINELKDDPYGYIYVGNTR